MYKQDLALNNLELLKCHKNKPNNLEVYGIVYSYRIQIIFTDLFDP